MKIGRRFGTDGDTTTVPGASSTPFEIESGALEDVLHQDSPTAGLRLEETVGWTT